MLPKLKYAQFPIYLLLALAIFLFYGCTPNNDDQSPPPATIITSQATGITANGAVLGGEITNDGGNSITERGVYYGTSPNPSVNNGKMVMGAGTGSFSGNVTGLSPNTLYYVRAFGLSSAGLTYGNQQSFTTLAKPPIDSAVAIYMGGWDTLYAYTADSGNVKWKKPLGGKALSSPVYANGKVYVGCTDSKLYAFDTSGNSLWAFTTKSYIGSQSPVIKNGLVYICDEQSRDIYAINAETGTQAWHFDATEPGAAAFGASDLTIYDNILYINSFFLYAIDATTGVLKWKYLNGGEVTPVKYNNKLYFTSRVYSLVVLDAVTGAFLWENNASSTFHKPLGLNVVNGKIYYSDDLYVCALDTINGSVLWKSNVYVNPPLTSGLSPIVVGNNAYFRTNGKVTNFNAETGTYTWQTLAEDVTGNMTEVNNILYYSSRITIGPIWRYHLYAVDLNSPNEFKWVSKYGAPFPFLTSSPCVVTKSGKSYRFGKVFN